LNLDNLRRQRKTEAEAVNSLKGKFENTEWQLKSVESDAQKMNERKSSLNDAIKSTSKDSAGADCQGSRNPPMNVG
jgi:structural maintenance of chromosome 1